MRTVIAAQSRPGRQVRALAGLLAAGALVLVVAGCSSATDGTNRPDSAGGGPVSPAVPGGEAAASPSAPAAVAGLRTPDQIGTLRKAADQSQAADLLKQISGTDTAKAHLVAIAYEDSSAKERTALIYGGSGLPLPPGSPQEQLAQMVKSGTATDAHLPAMTPVGAGPAGGSAACLTIPGGDGGSFVNCGWVRDGAALVITFHNFTEANAKSLVPTIISAMAGA